MTPTNDENASSSVPNSAADSRLDRFRTTKSPSTSNGKAVIVGLYGVPGSGKSILLNQLKEELGQKHFAFYKGSKMIATVVPGGLNAFQGIYEQA